MTPAHIMSKLPDYVIFLYSLFASSSPPADLTTDAPPSVTKNKKKAPLLTIKCMIPTHIHHCSIQARPAQDEADAFLKISTFVMVAKRIEDRQCTVEDGKKR